jgi:hypothetical protein
MFKAPDINSPLRVLYNHKGYRMMDFFKFLSRPTLAAFLLIAAVLLPSPVYASGGSSSPSWARFNPGNISLGLIFGQEYRFFSKTVAPNGISFIENDFHSNGLVSLGVTKYAFTDYFKVFAGYGLATKEGQPFHQMVATGIEYTDIVGVTLAFGGDTSKGLDSLVKRDNILIVLGVAFTPFEFNLLE